MKKLRVAQIGVGHDHACDIMTTLKRLPDIFEVVGYATVPEDGYNLEQYVNAAKKACDTGAQPMTVDEILALPELDAVFIETEDRALTKYAMLAAEKGLNIHMDKPGGIDGGAFERLMDLVEAKGKVFHTGYMYRYNPAVIRLKKDIAEGRLGDLISVEAQMNCSHALEKRDWLGSYPGGMLYFLGCHLIDLVYALMGEPKEILPLSCSSGIGGTEAEDFGMAVFRYEKGVSFVKTTAVEIGGFERRQLVAVGTKGTVEIKPLERLAPGRTDIFSPMTSDVREAFSKDWHTRGECHTTPVYGRYDAMLRSFAKYVRGEEENPFGYEYERRLHRMILRACGVR